MASTYGTNFGDGVRVGTVANSSVDEGAWGVPLSPYYTYRIIPEAAVTTNLRAAAAIDAAGTLTLTAGAGVTTKTDASYAYGEFIYELDVPRTLVFTPVNTVNDVVVTVSGYGFYGGKLVENITIPDGSSAVESLSAFKAVHSIQSQGATGGGTMAIGTGNSFGLPFRMTSASDIVFMWNDVPDYVIGADAADPLVLGGFFTPAFTASAGSPVTATTGDVRGLYKPNVTEQAPDDATILNLRMYLYYADPIYTRETNLDDDALKASIYGNIEYKTGWL